MVDAADIQPQYCPQCDHVAKGMEEGQNPEQCVVSRQVDHLVDRFNIRANIVIGEDHPFRIASGTGGENHGQFVVAS